MASISVSREELMAMLKAAKVKADREDAKRAAAHAKDEQAALKKFHDKCRAGLQMDYETAKKRHTGWDGRIELNQPACPRRHAFNIELAIRQVTADSRKGRFVLPDQHDWYKAAMYLPPSEASKESVCDK